MIVLLVVVVVVGDGDVISFENSGHTNHLFICRSSRCTLLVDIIMEWMNLSAVTTIMSRTTAPRCINCVVVVSIVESIFESRKPATRGFGSDTWKPMKGRTRGSEFLRHKETAKNATDHSEQSKRMHQWNNKELCIIIYCTIRWENGCAKEIASRYLIFVKPMFSEHETCEMRKSDWHKLQFSFSWYSRIYFQCTVERCFHSIAIRCCDNRILSKHRNNHGRHTIMDVAFFTCPPIHERKKFLKERERLAGA